MPLCIYKTRLKKQGIKTLKPLISQGFQVSASILVTQDGCGGRTWTSDLRVMRQSQGKIGVISAPICAFCRRSLGGFSIVSVQPCLLFSDSGSKLGQAWGFDRATNEGEKIQVMMALLWSTTVDSRTPNGSLTCGNRSMYDRVVNVGILIVSDLLTCPYTNICFWQGIYPLTKSLS